MYHYILYNRNILENIPSWQDHYKAQIMKADMQSTKNRSRKQKSEEKIRLFWDFDSSPITSSRYAPTGGCPRAQGRKFYKWK
jgi:hypothetical protein